MPIITPDDLRHGDILLCKDTGTVAHNVIGFGQMLFSGNKFKQYVHAAIYVGIDTGTIWDGPRKGTQFNGHCQIESHAPGITIGPIYPPLTAFRLKTSLQGGKRIALAAAEVAREFMGESQANQDFGQYNYAGATCSLFKTTTITSSVKSNIINLAEKKYSGKVFCSMLAVLCYQVATARLASNKTAPIKVVPLCVDSSSMQPSYLAQYLKTSPQWDEVGEWNGPGLY